MVTVKTSYSYSRVKNFLRKGGRILENSIDNNIVISYYNYLLSIGNKHYTILDKLNNVCFLSDYLNSINKNLKCFNKEDIYNYIETKYKMSLSSQDKNKIYIRLFLNWEYENNITEISGYMVFPKIIIHRNNNIRTYYTQEEITKFLNAIDNKTNKGKEDFFVLSTICYLGLRISDVINLKFSDIDFKSNTITIIQHKTGNSLKLPLIDEVKYPLIDYLKNVRPKDSNLDYILITKRKPYKKFDYSKNNDVVKKYMEKAGVNIKGRKHGFHALRHSFSSSLLKEDVPLYSISSLLGHQDIKTTMFYLDIDTSKLKELALEVPDVK